MSVAVEMVVPGLIGVWLDRRLGTLVLFSTVGFALGVTAGLIHLVRMTGERGSADEAGEEPDGGD